MKKLIYIVAVSAALVATSCTDYLDTENIYGLNTEVFYKTPDDINAAISGIYNAIYVNNVHSEEQIAAARRTYNTSVTMYNNAIMMFPGSIFAGMLNYQVLPLLETPAEERKNISAKDLFNN